ncbi:MAG: tryptophan synthase subunit alpha [Gammaproteobacteria bacterium]|nr:tryptophan synthase subunit alpha [Gammaproteobacteria bacterium]
MSRISGRFQQLSDRARAALIPFITAGDPTLEITESTMHAMVEAGADIIELGIPFSDPMADGPVIQKANERALKNDVSLSDVLELVSRFRQRDGETPVVLMGYLNPIECMGYETFAEKAGGAGVDGVITVDIPPEEADYFLAALGPREIDPIFLLSPTTTPERMDKICRVASGFVYYVSVKGITGAGNLSIGEVAGRVSEIRKHTALPVGVGFGIKTPTNAQAVAQVGDAVVVGSALINKMEALGDEQPEAIPDAVAQLLSSMREAMDQI